MNQPIKILIHATDTSQAVGKDQYNSVNSYHKSLDFPRSKTGSYVGYHRLITGGKNYKCREDDEIGAHCNSTTEDGKSLNVQSLGVCVGFDGDIEYMTPEHYELLKTQVTDWQEKYNIPDSEVYFHRDFNLNKTCPGTLLGKEWLYQLLKKTPNIKPKEQCEKQEAIIKELKEQVGVFNKILLLLMELLNNLKKI